MKELRVLVACGGGIATSTFAAAEIAKIAKELKILTSVLQQQSFRKKLEQKLSESMG